jgi:hypothetical protein
MNIDLFETIMCIIATVLLWLVVRLLFNENPNGLESMMLYIILRIYLNTRRREENQGGEQ